MIRLVCFTLMFSFQYGFTQTIKELYEKEDFSTLITYADKAEQLSGEELFCIGFAFFQLEDDMNAIKMYDSAIEKGIDEDYLYFYKGLALRYNNQMKESVKNFKIAVEKNPSSQKNLSELGNGYFFQEEYDSALVYFYRSRELPYETGNPYYKIPHIFHIRQDFKKALDEYNISSQLISKEDPVYIELLMEIGLLEFMVFEQFENSIKTYSEALTLSPKNYEIHLKLIMAYYAKEEFVKGDSLINILRVEFEKGKLPEEYQKYGYIPIADYGWQNQRVVVYKYFEMPKEPLDLRYKVFVFGEDQQSVERTLMTEKTIQFVEDGAKHVLCEIEKNGIHHTYPYGWSTDEIPFNSLKEAVNYVLDGKLNPSASSNFTPQQMTGKKKREKRKRN